MKTHGTHSGYVGGCRCEECKRGHAKYMADYRAKRGPTTNAKTYPRVETYEPPLNQDDWQELEADAFWLWFSLFSGTLHAPFSA